MPALWYVVLGALAFGLVIAAELQIIQDRPDQSKNLILKSYVGTGPALMAHNASSECIDKANSHYSPGYSCG